MLLGCGDRISEAMPKALAVSIVAIELLSLLTLTTEG